MLDEVYLGYGPKTLVTGWHCPDRASKDYDAYNPPFGNQFKSSFARLGNYEPPKILSESIAAQKKALKKQMSTSRKPLVNMLSYSSTLGDARKKFWSEVNINLPPDTVDCTNYESVSKTDFINFYPEPHKGKSRALMQKPETKFRRLMVDGNNPRRPGVNTFYDDNQEYLYVRKKARDPPPYGFF